MQREKVLKSVLRLSKLSHIVAEISLTLMVFLTVLDVILRTLRRPIVGTYELVAFLGAVVIGFSMPLTSWNKGHVAVDLFTSRLPQKARDIINILTRCFIIGLFLLIGWRLIKYGMNLHRVNQVSMTLQLPFYPVAYGLGMCCFLLCLVLVCDILKIYGGKYE